MMGLQEELRSASDAMIQWAGHGTSDEHEHKHDNNNDDVVLINRSTIALASGCELFMKYVTRCFLELPDFTECKNQVLERGERFAGISLAARDRIAELGQEFIQDGQIVLVHGRSRVVSALLIKAATLYHKHFEIILLEGRPDAGGTKVAKEFTDAGIPCTIVLDSAMGYVMERVDLVVVGAEGVVENGGIVNKIGTFALGVVAKEMGKPFYVAAESYKFARLYPLNQADLPDLTTNKLSFVDTASWEKQQKMHTSTTSSIHNCSNKKTPLESSNSQVDGVATRLQNALSLDSSSLATIAIPGRVVLPESIKVENPPCDFTPAKYITLLFTDLGVLTPSAVSDELIRLYQ